MTTRFVASITLRVPTRMQQRERERATAEATAAAIAAGEKMFSDAENDPTYRAARREMLDLFAGIQRLLSNYGYAVGPDGAAVEAELRVENS